MPKLIMAGVLAVVLLIPATVYALTSSDSANPQNLRDRVRHQIQTQAEPTGEAVREQTQTRVQEPVDAACQNVSARMQNRINQYEQNRDKWMTRHQGVIKRLNSLADKLEAQGCNAATIKTDAEKYQVLVSNFAAAFRLFHETINGSRGYICGQSDGQFFGKLRQAKNELQTVRTSASALQDFFQNTLRLHLRQVSQTCTETTQGTQ